MPRMSASTPAPYRCLTCQSASVRPRNLAVFIDGDSPSNVVKLFNAMAQSREDSRPKQRKYYLKGIGAYDFDHLSRRERAGDTVYSSLEMAFAWDAEKNVKNAYNWLAGIYEKGDQIYLFGFSRGAYQVRALASVIHEVGLVKDKDNTDMAYNHYRALDPYRPESRKDVKEFQLLFCWQGIRIHFVGVWETMSSLGLVKRDVHVTTSASVTNACHFRHALALDERRVQFMPEYFLEMNAHRTNIRRSGSAVSDIKEVWFAGSHSDVGGVDRPHDQTHAYSEDNDPVPYTIHAGNVPLVWMRQEAAAKGLVFDLEEFSWDPQDVDFGTSNSMSLSWKMIELLPARHQVSFTGTGRHERRSHLFRPRSVMPGQQIHPSVLSGDMYMPRATLGSGIGIPIARTSDGLWATDTQDEEAATRLLLPLLSDQQRTLACLEKVLFLLDSRLNNEQTQLIPRPQWSGEDILTRPGFDQFALAVVYDVTSHFTAPEELVRSARASLCSILSFPNSPDSCRAFYVLRFSTRHQTLRRHFIGHDNVIEALVLALEWTAKHSNENLFRLVTDSLCNLVADNDMRREVVDRLGAGPDRARGRSRLTILFEVKALNQLMASLKMIVSLAKFQPGCCEELTPKLIKLAKKERGLVGSAAVEALVEMNEPLTRDIYFSNILGYLCNTLPLLDAEGGSAYSADNIVGLPSVLQVSGSGPLEEGIMGKLLSSIKSRDVQERAAATLTFLKLCGNRVIQESCSRQVLDTFMRQLEQQGTSLLAAYALWACLKHNMWTSDDFFRAARLILDMVAKGWFDDVVGRLEGCQVFRRLMMSDELRQQVIHLGIVDILLKKLEVGDRHEVRMSLICLDILAEENSLELTPIVIRCVTHLQEKDKGAQKKGVKVLSALAQTVAGEQAIKPHMIDIVKMLLPSSDRPSVSQSQLIGPAAALHDICRNETLRAEIAASSEFNEWRRYFRGEHVDGDELNREIDGEDSPNRQSKVSEDVSREHAKTTSGRNLKPHTGPLKLVVAFDIGTVYSGVSYCILEPGQVPEILGVTRFPEQGLLGGDSKVPSLLYYDQQGNFRAAGAEVLAENAIEVALTEGWTRAEWWKLHLMPKHLASAINLTDDLPPLPPGKPAVDALTDFIQYLFHCTKTYIEEHHPSFTWETHENITEYILTHPNGWEGVQQQLYRQAVERAGLIPGTPEGRSRVHLLAEGEASLHFYVLNLLDVGTANEPTPRGVVIIDTGGATINLSMFSMMVDPISCEEIAPAECRLQGSVFVTRRARTLLQRKLEGWEHSGEEEIIEFTREFDHLTKLVIKSDQEPVYVEVAGRNYNNARYNIESGKLELSGPEATDVFNDSINAIINAFEQQLQSATVPITTVFLVGGLSTNDWVWSRLQSYFKARNIGICRPDNHIKAVASGAVLSRIDRDNRLVTSRVARVTYGVVCALPVDEEEEEHNRRRDQWEIDPTGDRYLPGCFEPIIRKGARISDEVEFRESFSLTERNPKHFGILTVRLVCYTGNLSDQDRVDGDESSFSTFCFIHVDLSAAVKDVILRKTRGQFYYELDYDVIISFRLTEIQAYLEWMTREGGQRRIPAMVSFDLDP